MKTHYMDAFEINRYNDNKKRKLTQDELDRILELHQDWLDGNPSGVKADLSNTYLNNVDLKGADLRKANLSDVTLNNVDLKGADLRKANLKGIDLSNTRLNEVIGTGLVCPEEGSFTGFKKIFRDEKKLLCKLEIPADAKRSSATTRKCRRSKAKVLEIWDRDDKGNYTIPVNSGYSFYDRFFEYRVGEVVSPDSFDEDRWDECSNGIHFFITKQEAINY